MIIVPTKKKELFQNTTNKLLLSYESYLPNQNEIKKLFKIIDENERIVEARLAYCNHISRNRCFYGLDDMMQGLKSSKFVQEQLAQGSLFFEKEHPEKISDLQRFMKIDDSRIAGRILKYWADGDFIMGLVQFLPPMGDMVWEHILKGVNYAFSLRVYTPNYQKCQDADGPYIKKIAPLYPCTFDIVSIPGYANCRLVDPDHYAANNPYWLSNGKTELLTAGKEDFLNIQQQWFIDNPLQQVKKLENTISSEALLQDLSDCLQVTLKSKKRVKKYEHPMYENTKIFHDLMKHV